MRNGSAKLTMKGLFIMLCLLVYATAHADGEVWTWGWDDYYQLGDSDSTHINRWTPVQTLNLTNIIAIEGGWYWSLALKSDSTVWGWGLNNYGQLGDNGVMCNCNSIPYTCCTPVQVVGPGGSGYLTNVIAIAAGEYHSLALKSDGTVWAWGYNGNGELGDNYAETYAYAPVEVHGYDNVGYLTDIIAIASGWNHSLALKSNGTVWAWGKGGYGRLGDSTSTSRSTPIEVHGYNNVGYLTGVIAIAGGQGHSLAIQNTPMATEEVCMPNKISPSCGIPTPFASVVDIYYSVPDGTGNLRVSVYNCAGRLVRTLVNEKKNLGCYKVSWDGRADNNDRIMNGVYFVKFEMELRNNRKFEEIKKVVLMR